MDIFGLEQREIAALRYRCLGLKPDEAAIQLNLSPSAYFAEQSNALKKLEIPGKTARERYQNFQNQKRCVLVLKLTEDDISHWYERRDELRKKLTGGDVKDVSKESIAIPEVRNRRRTWFLIISVGLTAFLAGFLIFWFNFPIPRPTPTPTVPATTPATTAPTDVSPTPQSPTVTPITPTNTIQPTNTEVPPTNTAKPVVPVLFNEDFEGNDVSPLWADPLQGEVPTISNGALNFQSETMYVLGDSSWKNYTVSISTKGLRCIPSLGFSLTIGVRRQESTGEMIAFRWFDFRDNCQPAWLKGQKDSLKPLPPPNLFALPNTANGEEWTKITVKAEGNTFTTSYGGEITIPDAWESGQVVIIGFQTMSIDNVRIEALP